MLFIPIKGVHSEIKYECQSYVFTCKVPSSSPTSWGMLTPATGVLSFTHLAMSCKQDISHRLTWRLNNPKHQSGANLVWPGGMKLRVTSQCSPFCTLQQKYHNTY